MTKEKFIGLLYAGYIDNEGYAKECYHKACINQRYENYPAYIIGCTCVMVA